jgi:hypothetical protein
MTKQESINLIIEECKNHGLLMVEQIAYVLATVDIETNHTFIPVKEAYYLRNAEAYRKTLRYYPYYGRGYVQITWRRNYYVFSKLLKKDLVSNPDLALDPNVARFILVYGFIHGSFTGKKITDYIYPGRVDYYNCRRCINSLDRARDIARVASAFAEDLKVITV